MNSLRTFFVICVISAFFFTGELFPQKQTGDIILEDCGLGFRVPARFILKENRGRWALFTAKYAPPHPFSSARLIINCSPNHRRTSFVSKLEDQAKQRGHKLIDFQASKLTQGLPAASYIKVRRFNKKYIMSADAYAASREWEFRLHLIPEMPKNKGKKPGPETIKPLLGELRLILQSFQFGGTLTRPISESTYETRLYIFLVVITLLIIAGLFLLFKKLKPKKPLAKSTKPE